MELRLAGIRDAWEAQNLAFDETRHLLTAPDFSARGSEALIARFLEETPAARLPGALLVGGDFMAAGAVKALQNAGLRVPQDISVMSIDAFNLAAIEDVPLTAVHVPRDALGEEAVFMLQQRLIRPQAAVGTLLLNGTLDVRESVRRVRPGRGSASVQRDGLYD